MKKKFLIISVLLLAALVSVFSAGCGKDSGQSTESGGISFEERTVELREGQSVKVTPKISSDGGGLIFWSVKDPEIATVDDDGNITALTSGSTVCYAQYGEDVARCIIVVKEYEAPDSLSIRISDDSFTLAKGDVFVLPIVIRFGKEIVTDYSVESVVTDKNVATEKDGVITAGNVGITDVLLKVSYTIEGRTYIAEQLVKINVY